MLTPGWLPNLLLVLTSKEDLGIPPKAKTSSIVGLAVVFSKGQPISDRENGDLTQFCETVFKGEVLPLALRGEAIPADS
jgi:hypothetical protein